jgi:ubiquinone/menaquinone biosynthesis C-methylase UbiE
MKITPDRARLLVRESYDRLGRRYADWARSNHDPVRARYTDALLESLTHGSRVLDLGCGDGSMLTERLATDHDVIGVDISRIQLLQARTSIPNARFICADVTQLELPESTFDAIAAFYCLTHIPGPELTNVIEKISRWLRPGGLFITSMGITDDPGSIEDSWLGVPMFFSGCPPDVNCRLLREVDLEIESDRTEAVEEFGRTVRFHWIAARKPG